MPFGEVDNIMAKAITGGISYNSSLKAGVIAAIRALTMILCSAIYSVVNKAN